MTPLDLAKLFADNIHRLMAEQNPPWNQGELARRLEMGTGNVSRLLSGKHAPTSPMITKIATMFGVDICELFCSVKPKKKKPSA